MSRAAARYLEVVAELRLARFEHALRGAAFTQDRELEYVVELDRWWLELTEEERARVELELTATPGAPEHLGIEDLDVKIGGASAPRREAA